MVKVLSFVPADLFKKEGQPAVFLEKKDAIYFFSNESVRSNLLDGVLDDLRRQSSSVNRASIVNVSGLVQFPGQYPLVEGMNLTQLLDAAGGSRDAAYTLSAEVTRMSIDHAEKASLEHVNISKLDDDNFSSSFVVSL